ncbi:hypothetical protein VTL71DRAFT_9723 [Oculimacula yallundae]|uniref:Uncharacterized protein n=1 Tax=Oculimacula yallundae TaxID=86028 RepID=A0ABR4BRM7_9HELO
MQSNKRAEVKYNTQRPEVCLRCAGEYSAFPELICSDAPNSTAGKCMNCMKKAKHCENSDLKASQASFDAEKKRVTHSAKVDDAAAAKSPWKPVVEFLSSGFRGLVVIRRVRVTAIFELVA